MQFEFEIMEQMGVFRKGNIDLIEKVQGTHDYICVS